MFQARSFDAETTELEFFLHVKRLFAIAAVLLLGFGANTIRAGNDEEYEKLPFNYSAAAPKDAIARLERRLALGEVQFSGSGRAVLEALLRELGVPVQTQLLVFSKTSFQRSRINPEHPRALYFSDTCYVGWVPGGVIEVTAIDPQLGPMFYSFDPQKPAATSAHRFVRESDCLRCHGGTFVRGIPGMLARSVFPDVRGEPLLRHGSKVVDFRTPFEERWGGWYVTGTHGETPHRGNVLGREENDALIFDSAKGSNVIELSAYFEVNRYPTSSSDIVALLVFEHQTTVQNALTQAAFDSRRMLYYQNGLQRAMHEPVTAEPVYDSVKSVFESATRSVVDALLSKDEAPLPPSIQGRPDFAAAFQADAPRDHEGESLKDLQLSGHLFRNRCSHLIYSEMFLALPEVLKRRIYERLTHALDARDPDPRYAYLDAAERARILAILRETHPELRSLWAAE